VEKSYKVGQYLTKLKSVQTSANFWAILYIRRVPERRRGNVTIGSRHIM